MIGVIAANSLWVSPYVFYYTKLLDELGLSYEIVYPNRTPNEAEQPIPHAVVLPWVQDKHPLMSYMQYARAVKQRALDKRYDALIVLTMQNGVFCSQWLKKHYKGRYLLDIRDYTHEGNPAYYALEKEAARYAALRVVSSPAFQTFLPPAEYLTCHNITTPEGTSPYRFEKKGAPVVIGYVGSVSYEPQCRRIMDLVHADPRFAFHFYGSGPAEAALRAYAETLHDPRICFFGRYQPWEKGAIIQKVDILFNAYGQGHPAVACLLANKLYDAFYYHKPLLTSPDTYMAEKGGKLAYSPDLDKSDALESLWNWYQTIDPMQADEFAANMYATVWQEQEATSKRIKSFLLAVPQERSSAE